MTHTLTLCKSLFLSFFSLALTLPRFLRLCQSHHWSVERKFNVSILYHVASSLFLCLSFSLYSYLLASTSSLVCYIFFCTSFFFCLYAVLLFYCTMLRQLQREKEREEREEKQWTDSMIDSTLAHGLASSFSSSSSSSLLSRSLNALTVTITVEKEEGEKKDEKRRSLYILRSKIRVISTCTSSSLSR